MGVPPQPPPKKNTFTLWIGLCQDWWLPLPARPNPYAEAKRDSDSSCLPRQVHPFTEFCPHDWNVSTHSITSRWFIRMHVNWIHLLLQAGSALISIINITWHLQKIFQLWNASQTCINWPDLPAPNIFTLPSKPLGIYLSYTHTPYRTSSIDCELGSWQEFRESQLTQLAIWTSRAFSRPITPSSRVTKESRFQDFQKSRDYIHRILNTERWGFKIQNAPWEKYPGIS